MARTPLLSSLLRSFRLLRAARGSGIPIEDYRGMVRSGLQAGVTPSSSRRRFLQAQVAGGALPFLPGALRPKSGSSVSPGGGGDASDARVVIVGAGLAGLHCAYRLQELGIHPALYDAASRVGGRVFTDHQTFGPAQHCELGGELINSSHATMLDLAEELGVPLLDYTQDDPTLDAHVFDVAGRRLTEKEVLDGFMPIANAIDEALGTLTDQDDPYVYYDRHNNGQALDSLSLAEWLDQIGAAGPVRILLEVAYTAEYGVEPDVNNVLNMLLLVSYDMEQVALFGESDERYHAAGGNDTFVSGLADALAPGQINLGMRLEAIGTAPNGQYLVTFARGATRVDVPADHVVLALPFSTLRDVEFRVSLPAAKRRAIRELGYGHNAKLMAGFHTRAWREQGYTGESISDRGYQVTWETSRLQPGATGIITNFAGGQRGLSLGEGTTAAQLTRFLSEFDAVFPGASASANGRAVRMHWPTYPFTRGSYAVYLVGQYTAFAGAEGERVNNLHFCGEHTSVDHQGFMEGAAATGAATAEEIAADLALAGPTKVQHIRATPSQRIRTRARLARSARRHGQALKLSALSF